MDYPNDKEVLESFSCKHALSVSYHTAYIARAARALSSSSKTSLRIEEGGLLSLQFLLPGAAPGGPGSKRQKDAFIEFRVSFAFAFCFFIVDFLIASSCCLTGAFLVPGSRCGYMTCCDTDRKAVRLASGSVCVSAK